jgi:predicted RecA/RadA family phage recombinase
MSKATYWQRGEALDYVNNTDKVIEANTVVALAERIGIAGTDIAPNKKGDLHVTGVFEFKKTSSNEIPVGTSVYFDGEGITEAADSNTPAGYAAENAGASDTTILVKIG